MFDIMFLGFSIILTFTHCQASNLILTVPDVGTLLYSSTTSAWSSKTIFQFRGVRYAESPTGDRRFKAPIPVAKRSMLTIQNVQHNGEQCPTIQRISNMTIQEMTIAEDCLHLSIYTKNLTANQPVIVYIHGGSFYSGGANEYPPNYLLEKNVVLVVPQYRLGPLGFLSTNTEDIPGNAGVLDVILALQWIQKHISHFGGSKESVTLCGQSAGAAIAGSLLYSPNTPPNLFHKIILESGTPISTWTFDGNAVENAKDIARLAGCSRVESVRNVNKCFKAMDTKTMLTAFLAHLGKWSPVSVSLCGGSKLTYGPSNNLFPLPPQALSENEAYKNIPVLGGTIKNDGTFVLGSFYDLQNSTLFSNREYVSKFMVDRMNQFMGISDFTGTLAGFERNELFCREIIESGEFNKMTQGLIDMASVTMFKGPILRIFQRRFPTKNLYLYTFDYKGEFTRFGYGADTSHYPFSGGVTHSDENLYLFPYPSFAKKLNSKDTIIAKMMVDFWTSFATNGKPTSTRCPNWPAFSTLFGPYLHINKRCYVGDDYVDEFTVASREK